VYKQILINAKLQIGTKRRRGGGRGGRRGRRDRRRKKKKRKERRKKKKNIFVSSTRTACTAYSVLPY